jgi:accessory gene regulator protein AgrB
MANMINGLEIANKRIKEKEELEAQIYIWLVIEIIEIIKIFELAGYTPTSYEKQRFLIQAHIVAEKKAEMMLMIKAVK